MLGHYTTAPRSLVCAFRLARPRVVRMISNFLSPVKPFEQPIFEMFTFPEKNILDGLPMHILELYQEAFSPVRPA